MAPWLVDNISPLDGNVVTKFSPSIVVFDDAQNRRRARIFYTDGNAQMKFFEALVGNQQEPIAFNPGDGSGLAITATTGGPTISTPPLVSGPSCQVVPPSMRALASSDMFCAAVAAEGTIRITRKKKQLP
jgi:hypothetical protein